MEPSTIRQIPFEGGRPKTPRRTTSSTAAVRGSIDTTPESTKVHRSHAPYKDASSSRRRIKKTVHKPSDSHDLNLYQHVTRDSMVENMLSSFNQISEGEARFADFSESTSAVSARPPDEVTPMATKNGFETLRQLRGANHSHSSSYASDYSLHASLDDESQASIQTTRQGSKGGSKGKTSIDKTRPENSKHASPRRHRKRNSEESQPRGKSAKSGAADSGNGNSAFSRWGRKSRAASIDQASAAIAANEAGPQPMSNSILTRPRPVPVEWHNFDAAVPMPNAPRSQRSHFSPLRPLSGHQNARQPSSLAGGFFPQSVLPQMTNSDSVTRSASTSNGLGGAQHLSVNPSPNERVQASRSHSNESIYDENGPKPAEKHGFFRRVFGSSKNANHTPDLPPQLPPLQTREDSPMMTSMAATSSSSPPPPAKATPMAALDTNVKELPIEPPPVPDNLMPVLNKKTSFFRRKKKAPGETMLNADTSHDTSASAAVPSTSGTSLSKVMNPYLNETPAGPEERFFDSREQQPDERDDGNIYSFAAPSGARRTNKAAARSPIDPQTPPLWNASTRSDDRQTSTAVRPSRGDRIRSSKSMASDQDNNSSPAPSALAAISPAQSPAITPNSASEQLPLQQKTRQPTPDRAILKGQKAGATDLHTGSRRTSASPGASAKNLQAGSRDDGRAMTAITRTETAVSLGSNKANRVWVRPTNSEEALEGTSLLPLPAEGAAGSRAASTASTVEEFVSTTSLPSVHVQGSRSPPPNVDSLSPGREDREEAAKIFHGKGDYVDDAKGAVLLGEAAASSARLRKAYMEFFDFSGQNILAALRELCGKLALKGETQQVDRILGAFSHRWCQCNPKHGFKSQDVVHTLCYSILLLNTDMHVADLDSKMTRPQFIKNTLSTLLGIAAEHDPDATLKAAPLPTRGALPWGNRSPSPGSPITSPIPPESRDSTDFKRASNRLSVRPPKPDSDLRSSPTPLDDTSEALVNRPCENSGMRGWEQQLEGILKMFYNSIRQERLPLYGSSEVQLQSQTTNNSLAAPSSGLRRTGSMASKAPSEGPSNSSRGQDFRSGGARFYNKNRSRSKVYPASTVGSSRTSLDEPSVWSQSASSTWGSSIFSRARTAMSTDSLASRLTQADYGYQQSIGFANALSHAIVREESGNFVVDDFDTGTPLLDDESLELAGAPWAKEGIVHHKHHLVTVDKKAKDRNWEECFAVVEKGWLRLFSFSSKASVRNQKNKLHGKGGVVGGGNWMDNAENVGSFPLRQTIANALPPPGYSKPRPYVFALSLPTGAVHLFQVGTPDIVREFVSTANYWSARLSKEPLATSVSNVEYGWSEAVINAALLHKDESRSGVQSPPVVAHSRTISQSARESLQGSIRNSIDIAGVKARLPGDKMVLTRWTPPPQSMRASELAEWDQLDTLKNYVKDVEAELSTHNELRGPMSLAFTPRHPNAIKAHRNWELQSQYLLKEIVKFGTYIESLKSAHTAREKLYAERAANPVTEQSEQSERPQVGETAVT